MFRVTESRTGCAEHIAREDDGLRIEELVWKKPFGRPRHRKHNTITTELKT